MATVRITCVEDGNCGTDEGNSQANQPHHFWISTFLAKSNGQHFQCRRKHVTYTNEIKGPMPAEPGIFSAEEIFTVFNWTQKIGRNFMWNIATLCWQHICNSDLRKIFGENYSSGLHVKENGISRLTLISKHHSEYSFINVSIYAAS